MAAPPSLDTTRSRPTAPIQAAVAPSSTPAAPNRGNERRNGNRNNNSTPGRSDGVWKSTQPTTASTKEAAGVHSIARTTSAGGTTRQWDLPNKPIPQLRPNSPPPSAQTSKKSKSSTSHSRSSSSVKSQTTFQVQAIAPITKAPNVRTINPTNSSKSQPKSAVVDAAGSQGQAATVKNTGNAAAPRKRNRQKKLAASVPADKMIGAADSRKETVDENDGASSSGEVDDDAIFKKLLESRRNSQPSDSLEDQILRLYETKRASKESLAARQILIERLESLFNYQRWFWSEQHGRHDYQRNPIKIEPFGSIRFGLATDTSDLDLVMLDPFRPNGFDDFNETNFETLPEIYNTTSIARRLQSAGCSRVQAIPFAGVPIVKFEAMIGEERIQVDINTNECLGLFNSKLLAAYCDISPVVRPMCVFVKFWAKQRRLNDPSGASGLTSFSSYTLVLLVISYLQTLNILPNLQDAKLIASVGMERRKFFTRPKKSSGRRSRKQIITSGGVGWDVTFMDARDYKVASRAEASPEPIPTIDKLIRGFFAHFAEKVEMDREVVSIAWGGSFARDPSTLVGALADAFDTKAVIAKFVQGQEEGEISIEDQSRQNEEDEAILALAEMEGRVESRPMSSTPVAATALPGDADFEQPLIWQQKLIVQDPFILSRNTALNVSDTIVDTFVREMERAIGMIDLGATIPEICSSISNEAAFKAGADNRRAERNRRKKKVGGSGGGARPTAAVQSTVADLVKLALEKSKVVETTEVPKEEGTDASAFDRAIASMSNEEKQQS